MQPVGRSVATATAVTGSDTFAEASWTMEPSDDAVPSVFLDMPTMGTWEPDFYRDAGNYYLSSNTLDYSWTITISELR